MDNYIGYSTCEDRAEAIFVLHISVVKSAPHSSSELSQISVDWGTEKSNFHLNDIIPCSLVGTWVHGVSTLSTRATYILAQWEKVNTVTDFPLSMDLMTVVGFIAMCLCFNESRLSVFHPWNAIG